MSKRLVPEANILDYWLKRSASFVSKALFAVAATLVLMMTLFVSYDVLMRHVLGRPLPFSDEIGAYLLVAITYLGLAYTLREDRHINIDVVTRLMNARANRWTSIIVSVLSLVTMIVFTWQAFRMVQSSYRYRVATYSVLATPLWIPQLFVAIGLLAFSLQMVSYVITTCQRPQQQNDSTEETVNDGTLG